MIILKQTTFVLLFMLISGAVSSTPFAVVEENLNSVTVSFVQGDYYIEDTNGVTQIKYDGFEETVNAICWSAE